MIATFPPLLIKLVFRATGHHFAGLELSNTHFVNMSFYAIGFVPSVWNLDMMTCKDVAEFLSEYLDRRLPWSQRVVFRLHLLLCRDCRRYLDSFQKTQRAICSLKAPAAGEEENVPDDLVKAILAARRVQASDSHPHG